MSVEWQGSQVSRRSEVYSTVPATPQMWHGFLFLCPHCRPAHEHAQDCRKDQGLSPAIKHFQWLSGTTLHVFVVEVCVTDLSFTLDGQTQKVLFFMFTYFFVYSFVVLSVAAKIVRSFCHFVLAQTCHIDSMFYFILVAFGIHWADSRHTFEYLQKLTLWCITAIHEPLYMIMNIWKALKERVASGLVRQVEINRAISNVQYIQFDHQRVIHRTIRESPLHTRDVFFINGWQHLLFFDIQSQCFQQQFA